MDKRFAKVQDLVRGRERCDSHALFPHVFLDCDKWQRLPYTWEEGLPTKLAAVWEAEKLLGDLYRQAEQKVWRYTDSRSPDSFLLRVRAGKRQADIAYKNHGLMFSFGWRASDRPEPRLMDARLL